MFTAVTFYAWPPHFTLHIVLRGESLPSIRDHDLSQPFIPSIDRNTIAANRRRQEDRGAVEEQNNLYKK